MRKTSVAFFSFSKSAKESNDRFVGKTVKVLVEGVSKKNENILSGYSEENKLVNFKGDVNKVMSLQKMEKYNIKFELILGQYTRLSVLEIH